MAIIEKKVLPEYFTDILAGKKKFELRLGDFDIQEGDTLLLKEWNGTAYTGRTLEKKVGYVLQFDIKNLFWPKEDIEKHGLQVIQLE